MKSCPLGLYNKNADEICVCPSVTTTTALATTSWKVAELNVTFACKKRTDERFSNALCFSQRQCYCQEQLSDTKGPYKLALFFRKHVPITSLTLLHHLMSFSYNVTLKIFKVLERSQGTRKRVAKIPSVCMYPLPLLFLSPF